jgi:hypothetical protein
MSEIYFSVQIKFQECYKQLKCRESLCSHLDLVQTRKKVYHHFSNMKWSPAGKRGWRKTVELSQVKELPAKSIWKLYKAKCRKFIYTPAFWLLDGTKYY